MNGIEKLSTRNSTYLLFSISTLIFFIIGAVYPFASSPAISLYNLVESTIVADTMHQLWQAPDISILDSIEEGQIILYGRELIAHTSQYYGPKGSLHHSTNGMNCQNCHLDAGTKQWGNNNSAVYSTYPKFRERSGTQETVVKRINDCFMRSLNGEPIDSTSREMVSIIAYIKWLGQDVKKGVKPLGSGLEDIEFMDREASPQKGKTVYLEKCQSCHQKNGKGMKQLGNKASYLYPPLWGKNSYSIGAGLYRLSRFAGYVKNNMPLGATRETPLLTNTEAWDVAAFVNSNYHPDKDLSKDFPKIAGKPIDYPFPPYADTFSVQQHKYGPFYPIVESKKSSLYPIPIR